jgi:hypothetical protein
VERRRNKPIGVEQRGGGRQKKTYQLPIISALKTLWILCPSYDAEETALHCVFGVHDLGGHCKMELMADSEISICGSLLPSLVERKD